MSELEDLAASAGAEVIWKEIERVSTVAAGSFIRSGKVDAIRGEVEMRQADLVIVDQDLTPMQQRNLEDAWEAKVVDRTGLILDIFAQRARTQEGKLQVELAQLTYLLPRLVGRDRALSRLGGGIGTRGPGERKLEMRRRVIRDRIAWLKRELESVRDRRQIQRGHRKDVPLPGITLIGYTNAGKSSLFNALIKKHGHGTVGKAFVADQLFATLDPMTRAIKLPSGRVVLLSDTVGFIRKLPHQLVEAFRATFEELGAADLLLHVVDASSPMRDEHGEAVRSVLEEIGSADKPSIMALNKIDLLGENRPSERGAEIGVSASTGEGLDDLVLALEAWLDRETVHVTIRVRGEGKNLLSMLYGSGHVLNTRYSAGGVEVEARLHRKHVEILRHNRAVEFLV